MPSGWPDASQDRNDTHQRRQQGYADSRSRRWPSMPSPRPHRPACRGCKTVHRWQHGFVHLTFDRRPSTLMAASAEPKLPPNTVRPGEQHRRGKPQRRAQYSIPNTAKHMVVVRITARVPKRFAPAGRNRDAAHGPIDRPNGTMPISAVKKRTKYRRMAGVRVARGDHQQARNEEHKQRPQASLQRFTGERSASSG